MIEQTLSEWKAEGVNRFGEDVEQHVFKCPKCGRENKVIEFKEYADSPDSAVTNCIGRYNKSIGCDWAAYGLFRTLGKGRVVIMPNGEKLEVFDFGGAYDK
ncbi:VVA0879 family protein [Streptococcus azizii]|uniref:Phage protein n=1 Tax=Streptococcus azizii TaxID=1579424 RepID=A0AB36JPZ8_9STRE|nr:VVA0879 family protein [Streptococcus azizii]ONK25712.1 hypothetical protein BVE86_09385 [Streptococcus azizii]